MNPLTRTTLRRLGQAVTETSNLESVDEALEKEAEQAARNPKNVIGRYVLVAPVGRGSSGHVYRAYDRTLHRTTAVKVIPVPTLGEAEIRRLEREFVAMALLHHPHIVAVYAAGVERGLLYYAMEWMKGLSLQHAIQKGPLEPRRAAEIVRQVALALDYAHRKGFVHQDVKPSNILLSDGVAKLADFGAVRSLMPTDDSTAIAVRGTPGYMAPEQAAGRRSEIDQRSDIFGLGATLRALLTGVPHGRPVADRGLRRMIHRATDPNRPNRYPSALDFAKDLHRWLAHTRWVRRMLVAVATVVLLTVTGTFIYWNRPAARIDRLEQTVHQKVGKEKLAEAKMLFEEALPLAPEQISLLRLRAGLLLETPEYDAADSAYREILHRDASQIDDHRGYLRAVLGSRLKRFCFHRQRYEDFEALAKGQDVLASAAFLRRGGDPVGQLLLDVANGELSTSAVAATNDLPYEFLLLRGLARLYEGRPDAREDLGLVRLRWPGRHEGELAMALCELAEGFAQRALDLSRTLDDPEGRRIQAVSLLSLGDIVSAIPILEGLRDFMPEVWADLGTCRLQNGDLTGAEKEYRGCLERSPHCYVAGYHLALVLGKTGRCTEAIDLLERLIRHAQADDRNEISDEPVSEFDVGERASDDFYLLPRAFLLKDPQLNPVRAHPDFNRRIRSRIS